MKLICELSGEHPDLPFAELEIAGPVVDRRPQVAVVDPGSPEIRSQKTPGFPAEAHSLGLRVFSSMARKTLMISPAA